MVEISGLDAESDILEDCEEGELSKDIAKVYSYPDHVLHEKNIKELKLLVRFLNETHNFTE